MDKSIPEKRKTKAEGRSFTVKTCSICGRLSTTQNFNKHCNKIHPGKKVSDLQEDEEPRQGYYWWEAPKAPNDHRPIRDYSPS